MKYLRKYKLVLIGILVGALGGLIYWKFIGCSTYLLSSSPMLTLLWGAVAGGTIFDAFTKKDVLSETCSQK